MPGARRAGPVSQGARSRARNDPPAGRAPAFDVVVGAAIANRADAPDPSRVEQRYYTRTRDGRVELLTAPEYWTRLGAPLSGWLPLYDTRSLNVRIVAP